MTGCSPYQIVDCKLPFVAFVRGLWQLRNVVAGVAKRNQRAAARQRDRPVKFVVPIIGHGASCCELASLRQPHALSRRKWAFTSHTGMPNPLPVAPADHICRHAKRRTRRRDRPRLALRGSCTSQRDLGDFWLARDVALLPICQAYPATPKTTPIGWERRDR